MKKKYTKSKKYKKKKSILKNRFFFYLISIIFLILFFYYFFIFSNVFQVRTIQVKGEQFNSKEDIISIVEPFLEKRIIFKTESIFLINTNHIKNNLIERFPSINHIKVSKILPRRILINITERIPKIVIRYQGKDYLIDEQGLIFKKREKEYDLPLIISQETFNINDIVLSISLVKKITEIDKYLEPEYFDFEEKDIVANIGNTRFIFDVQKSIDQQIDDLLLLLERYELKIENLEYVDLRFDKIFYREK